MFDQTSRGLGAGRVRPILGTGLSPHFEMGDAAEGRAMPTRYVIVGSYGMKNGLERLCSFACEDRCALTGPPHSARYI